MRRRKQTKNTHTWEEENKIKTHTHEKKKKIKTHTHEKNKNK